MSTPASPPRHLSSLWWTPKPLCVSVQHSSTRRPKEAALTERSALLFVSSFLEPRCTNVADFTPENQQNGCKPTQKNHANARLLPKRRKQEGAQSSKDFHRIQTFKRKCLQAHYDSRGPRQLLKKMIHFHSPSG